MIKGILFDVHGTLIDKGGKAVLDSALINVVRFLNNNEHSVTFEEYQQTWVENLRKHRKDLEELNEVDFYDWHNGILSDLGVDGYDKGFIDRLNDHFMKAFQGTTREMPSAKFVLRELKKSFSLGIVSNSMGRNTRADLMIAGMIDLFDGIFISSEIGKRKPHPMVFQKALEGICIRSDESVFVGDDLFEDIMGANQAGIKTVFIAKDDSMKGFSEKEVFGKILKDKGLTKEGARPERIEKADFIIRDLKELLSLAEQWKK